MTVCIIIGDALLELSKLPAESAHCCVTSPPYYGLRDYGVTGQIGLEPSPDEYVATLVGVFREVRRVLRKDGTVWLNIGDSYCSIGHKKSSSGYGTTGLAGGIAQEHHPLRRENNASSIGCKHKDLIGIPWLLAFALRADGWYLRQDIIWSKPNPMPESVIDRPTKAHEYLFLLAKSERYFYDADAIKEPMKDVSLQRLSQPNVFEQPGGPKDPKSGNRSHRKAINNQAERLVKHEKWKTRFEGWDAYDKSLGRNARSVWEIATAPFPEAHFATFPPALIEPCIKAGTSEKGCCAKCGAPWGREVERTPRTDRPNSDGVRRVVAPGQTAQRGNRYVEAETTGWSPSCACNAEIMACTVLDPFSGAGTTGLVADRLGRNAVLIELNSAYATMAECRVYRDAPLLAAVSITNQRGAA